MRPGPALRPERAGGGWVRGDPFFERTVTRREGHDNGGWMFLWCSSLSNRRNS